MKIPRICGVLLWAVLIASCSKDSAPGQPVEEAVIPDFRMIGEDETNIYQFNYDASQEEGSQLNLTQALGVDPLYLTLRQVNDVVFFYSFSDGSFSVISQNTLTGQTLAYPDFYTVTEERSITWGINSEDLLFLGYYSPKGSRDFGLRTIEPLTGNFTDLPLALNVQQVYDPLYFRERLFVTYKDENGRYVVAVFNTETRALLQTFDFATGIPNLLINEIGNLGIIIGTGNENFVYQIYDIETLALQNEIQFQLNEFLPAGPLQGAVFGNTLYYTNLFAQPATVPFGPAFYDFVKDENVVIDILSIVQEVEAATQFTVNLTALRYFEEEEVFLMGYANAFTPNGIKGGVLVISREGNLLERIEVPFAPTYFVKP